MDGEPLPGKPLQPDFDAAGGRSFIMAYQSLFSGTGFMFHDLGFLEESLKHRIPPKWSLVATAAPTNDPWWSSVDHNIKLKSLTINKYTNLKPRNNKKCKDAPKQIIELGLVEILSTPTARHLVKKRIAHKKSLITLNVNL